MSHDDKRFMTAGFYVRHAFGRKRRGRCQCCTRCGVKRRHVTSGWEWTDPQFKRPRWTTFNPPCTKRDVTP